MSVHVHLHFRDAFVEADHPRVKGGEHAGEFAPVEKSESGKFTLPSGGKLPLHIAKLRIPPAWTGVRYNSNPRAALLVVGKDSKGRRVSIYSARHARSQSAQKFKRIQQLEPKFDRIMQKNAQAMRSRDPKKRELAAVLGLIMHTGIRPGSEQDTGAERQAYGATTLEGRHVVSNGSTKLEFVGKKGKDLSIPISDPEIAADLKKRARDAGANGKLFPQADARRLLAHVQTLAGKAFKTKDFRTLIGTKVAMAEAAKLPVPRTVRDYKRQIKEVATKVAETLGNTPTIALQSYIAPQVFSEWHLASGIK